MKCRICGNVENNRIHLAKEMMFGMRDEFEYIECGNCGCLQIAAIPENLNKYYPANEYYAYSNIENQNKFKLFFKRRLADHLLKSPNLLGALLKTVYGVPFDVRWFKNTGVDYDSEILEIGCGSGQLLLNMQNAGFKHLTGADPFVAADLHYGMGLTIYKKYTSELDKQFDLIMMHHSFEHVPEPLETLKDIHRLLKPGAHALIRIPVMPSYAWTKYGTNWVQLDAPRHLYLHSIRSMQIMAESANLTITDVNYDSTDIQFWGSEQYLQGIPLKDEKSYAINRSKSIFTREQIRQFRHQTSELNRQQQGDQACFILKKKGRF